MDEDTVLKTAAQRTLRREFDSLRLRYARSIGIRLELNQKRRNRALAAPWLEVWQKDKVFIRTRLIHIVRG